MTIRCKVCNQINPNNKQKTCGYTCRGIYLQSPDGIADVAKALSKVRAERKLKNRQKATHDLKWWKKKVQRRFNKYIRIRDKDKPCISCGATNYRITAGHYKTVGSTPALRYHPMNAHGQCWWNCNKNRSGNVTEARLGIIERYGVEVVDFLEGYNADKKYTIDNLKIIDKWFKRKTERLK